MHTATNIQENAEDILAEAKQINEEREAEAEYGEEYTFEDEPDDADFDSELQEVELAEEEE